MNLRRILAAIYYGPRFAFDEEPDDDFDELLDEFPNATRAD